MFIKEIRKKNPYSNKVFTYHRLIESYRTEKGPRHRTILNLGKLSIDKKEWKLLANRIEEILHKQDRLFEVPEDIESLAWHYASLINAKKLNTDNVEIMDDYQLVDVNKVNKERVRSIGNEHIFHTFYKKLQFPEIFDRLGFREKEKEIAELLIAGRMINPDSELSIYTWANENSGLSELLNTSFKNTSLSSLYRTMDKIYSNKEKIEEELRDRERDIFKLGEKVILYDLTNTYFEGRKYKSRKITFGRSKDKRNDARIITIGLVVDSEGFAKSSYFFEGNISEPKTLKEALSKLRYEEKPTIIMDAGIGTEENIKYLIENGFDYICVSRKRPKFKVSKREGLVLIKEVEGGKKVEAKFIDKTNEVILYCESEMKKEKEQSMMEKFCKRYEEELNKLRGSILRKGGVKRYEKVIERMGRIKERSNGIHRLYDIEIIKDEKGRVKDLKYRYNEKEYIKERYEGKYYIRTSRRDLSEKELWELYMTIIGIEDTFRVLKDELMIRPVYHYKEERIEAHLFIGILAYHVLSSIRYRLRSKGILMRWKTIRNRMGNHVISTVRLKEKSGKVILIRTPSVPEYHHNIIYEALGITNQPIPPRKSIM